MANAAHSTPDAEIHDLRGSSPSTGQPPKFEPIASGDADLMALIRRHEEATLLADVASDKADALYEDYLKAKPKRPAALLWRGFGEPGYMPIPYINAVNGTGTFYYTAKQVEELRTSQDPQMYVARPGLKSDDGTGFASVPDPKKIARKVEIITAWEEWEAEKKRVMDSVGALEASNCCDEILQARDELSKGIDSLRPTTLTGLVAKARWATDNRNFDENIARSVLSDLCALGADLLPAPQALCTYEELAAIKFEPLDLGDWKPPTAVEWAALENPFLVSVRISDRIIRMDKESLITLIERVEEHDGIEAENLAKQLQNVVDFFQFYHRIVDAATIRYMSAWTSMYDGDEPSEEDSATEGRAA